MKQLRIAFIGSRKLAESQFNKDAKLFYQVAHRCAELGIILTSGGAQGADIIGETAYANAIKQGKAIESQVEIFIPWKNFAKDNPLAYLHILPSDPVLIKQAEQMVKQIHPLYKKGGHLTQGAMKLHSRNMNQVFGKDLNTPIDACICWTEGGIKSGGSRSAIVLCEKNNIPVFNLGGNKELVIRDFRNFLKEAGVQGLKNV